jgi:hypothetical protein
VESKTIPSAPPTYLGSGRKTWVTQRTEHIGNTFGRNGFSKRFQHKRLQIELSQIIIHKAEQPDIVLNFFDADRLAGKDLAEVNFFVPQSDAAAICTLEESQVRKNALNPDVGHVVHQILTFWCTSSFSGSNISHKTRLIQFERESPIPSVGSKKCWAGVSLHGRAPNAVRPHAIFRSESERNNRR